MEDGEKKRSREEEDAGIEQQSGSFKCRMIDSSDASIETISNLMSTFIKRRIIDGISHSQKVDVSSLTRMEVQMGVASGNVILTMTTHTSPHVSSMSKFSLRCKRDTAVCYACNGGFGLATGEEDGKYRFDSCDTCEGTGFIKLKPPVRKDVVIMEDGFPGTYEIDYPYMDNLVDYLIEAFEKVGYHAKIEAQDDVGITLSIDGKQLFFPTDCMPDAVVSYVNDIIESKGVAITLTKEAAVRETTEDIPTRILRHFYRIEWNKIG